MHHSKFLDWLAAKEVFYDHAFQFILVETIVQSPFRVHKRDGTRFADTQALAFAATDGRVHRIWFEFHQSFFQIDPKMFA